MFRLVYMSKAIGPMDDAALDRIARKAQEKNRALGLTGLLVFVDNTFFQVLEGPQVRVEEVFDRVYQDQRHHRARILQQREVECRRFADWTMGFCRLSNADEDSDVFFELSRKGFEDHIPQDAGDDLIILMQGFAKSKLAPSEPLLFS